MQAVIAVLEKAKQLIIIDHIYRHLAEGDAGLTPQMRDKLGVFREITHGVIDASIPTTTQGISAIKWSFVRQRGQ